MFNAHNKRYGTLRTSTIRVGIEDREPDPAHSPCALCYPASGSMGVAWPMLLPAHAPILVMGSKKIQDRGGSNPQGRTGYA